MCLSTGNGGVLLNPNVSPCMLRPQMMHRCSHAAWLPLIAMWILAYSIQAQAFGPRIVLDDAKYTQVPLAARLMRGDYTNLPPRHRAKQFPVKDFKRLFERGEANKVVLVKKSLAEAKPVVVVMHVAASFHSAKAVWSPSPQDYTSSQTACVHDPCHLTMTVVGYDDAKYGGAFEVMHSQGTRWGDQGFLWVRYTDFQHFCWYAFELIEAEPHLLTMTEITGSIRFEAASGVIMPARRHGGVYKLLQSYPSGTRLRVMITTTVPVYLYVFSTDLKHTSYRLFPGNDRTSAHLGYKVNHLALPDETGFYQLDNNPGTDYFCVLYAKRKLDVMSIMRQIGRVQGDLLTRLHTVLGKHGVAESQGRLGLPGEIRFRAQGRRDQIVPIVVEIPHT